MSDLSTTLKRQDLLFWVFVIGLIVLLLPTLVRIYSGNDNLLGSEPYYHLQAASELKESEHSNPFSEFSKDDTRIFTERSYIFSPYTYLLAGLSGLTSIKNLSHIIPFVLGILSILLFNLILKKFFEEKYRRHIILIMLLLNPAFIYLFSFSNPHALAITLTLAGFYLFMRPGKVAFVGSLLCFLLVSLFTIFNTLLALLMLLAYILWKQESHNRFIVILLILALISFTRELFFHVTFTYSPDLSIIQNLFSDLGGLIGFGIFMIMLAIYGVVSHWRQKSKFLVFFLVAILLCAALYLLGNFINMYLSFFIAVAAGLGFLRLAEANWNLKPIKDLTLLVLICGLLFSTVSYINRVTAIEPDNELITSLEWMRDNTFKDGYVLTHFENAFWLSTVSQNPVFVDSLVTSGSSQRFLYKVSDTMFHSRDLEEVKGLLNAYEINYIFIDKKMKSGLVWSKDNQGLLFLLSDKDTFKNVYNKDDIEIWEIINVTSSK